MRVVSLIAPALLTVYGGVATPAQEAAKPAAAAPQPQASDAWADKSKVVYVSDFELDAPTSAVEKSSGAEKGAPSSAPAPAAQPDAKREEGPAEQASKFVELMSSTLVKELENAGFIAHRMRPNEARPEEGIHIKGVFAEPDEENRLRLAVVGNGPSVGKMALFVGVGNLARPDQPLYAVVDPKGSASTPGALITVSAYAPVAKFEMPKNATEKAVKETASAIVADLTLLLNMNIAAVTH